MDIIAPATEVTEELVRESLMAISNLLPDSSSVAKELGPDSMLSISSHIPDVSPRSDNLNGKSSGNSSEANLRSLKESGEIEYHRSELISLSYTQPTEPQPLPHSPGNPEC